MKTFDEMLSQNIFDGNRHALNTDAKQGYISSSSGIAEDVSNSSVDRMETNASVGDLPPRQRVVVETPLWFRQGADLESLLHRADSLDWLADSGVPVKVDEPTTTNSSDIVVISESKHKPAAIGAVGIIPSSNAQYCPPPHAMLPPVSYHAQSTYSHIPFQNQPAYIPNGHNGNAPVAVLERPHAGLQHCASSSSVSSPHAGYGDIQNQASGQYQYTTISPRQEQIFNEYPQPYIQNSIPIVGEHSMLPIPMHQPMYNVLSSSGSGAVPNYSQQSQKSFNQQQCFQYQQLPRPQLSEVQYQPHLPQKLPQHPLSTSNGYSTYVNPSGNTAVMMNDQSMPPPVSILPISSPLVPLQQLDTESELKAHLLGLSDDEGEEAHTQYKLVPSMVDQKNISSTPTVPVFDGGIAVDSQSKIDQIMVKIESGIASGVANKKHNNLSDHTEPTLDVSDGPSLSSHDSPVSVDSIASSLDQRKISNTKLTL